MWRDDVQRDVRFAGRALFRSRGFTAVAVLMLAVGVDANTAIFSLVDTLMLRSLPVRHPDELVEMLFKFPGDPRSANASRDSEQYHATNSRIA